jgi:hypothetical protein
MKNFAQRPLVKKSLVSLLGIIAIVAVIGLGLIGCDDLFDDDDDDDKYTNSSNPNTLRITDITAAQSSLGHQGIAIGIFFPGTPPDLAMQRIGIVAGAEKRDIMLSYDSSTYITTFYTPKASGTGFSGYTGYKWTEDGIYDIYLVLGSGSTSTYYRVQNISFTSSATTTVSVTRFFPVTSGSGSGGGEKPATLSTSSATYNDVIFKLEEIINYPDTPAITRTNAQSLKNTLQTSASTYQTNWSSMRLSLVTQVNNLIATIPNSGNGGGNNNGGGGGGGEELDSALVAKWHSTQAAADSGASVVFEITSGGSMTGEAFNTDVKVTTSAGKISATVTVSGQTVSGGSADYVVEGTTLTLSNPSTGSLFTPLITAINAGKGAGGDGKYHKKAGNN